MIVKSLEGSKATLKTEVVSILESYQRVWNLTKQLDWTTIQILKVIEKLGPRNLLAVARRTKIPFSTVYNRIGKLEATNGPISFAYLDASKLGLVPFCMLTSARPGRETAVTEALKIPKYWRLVSRCEGGYSHDSVHYVPFKHVKTFQQYLKELVNSGLVSKNTLLRVGNYVPNQINYDYYDPRTKRWTFCWDTWLKHLMRQRATGTIEDPMSYEIKVDKRDLEILRQLQNDGRKSFAKLAKSLGITLQAVKYRFDHKLTRGGIIGGFGLNSFPCPPEVAAYYELLCEFPSKNMMNKLFSFVGNLFFVMGVRKVIKRNSLMIRVVIIDSQALHLFRFLSELCKKHILTSYSTVRLRLDARELQPLRVELFDDTAGWTADYRKWVSDLKKLN